MNNNGYEISWREIPPKIVETKSWEQVKTDLEQRLANMGLQIVIGEVKKPQAYKMGMDGVDYIVVVYYRNGNEVRLGKISHNIEQAAEELFYSIQNEIKSTRIAHY